MVSKKKVMILGAGVYQVPLIQRARDMGLHTIVVSVPGPYPGFRIADEVCELDTTNIDAVLEEAKRKQIDAIVTSGTDVCIPTLGKVCDEMGLTGVSYESAVNASNKISMKNRFKDADVLTAFFDVATNAEGAMSIIDKIDDTAIVKAIDSSGSRGITIVGKGATIDEVKRAADAALAVSREDEFLVEHFLAGDEFGVQALVYDGKVKLILPHSDEVFVGDTGVPVGHAAPFTEDAALIEKIEEEVKKGIAALGIDNCAVNIDCILYQGKPYMIEMAARVGATCLAELVSTYYGVDYYEILLRIALGDPIDDVFDARNGAPVVGRLITADKTGKIKSIRAPENLPKDIVDFSLDYSVGDEVREFKVGPDRIGQVVAKGATLEEAEKTIDDFIAQIDIEIE